MRKFVLLILFVLVGKEVFGAGDLFEFKPTNESYISEILQESYKNVYLGNLVVYSTYINNFVKENWSIDNFSSYLLFSNNTLYLQIVSDKTNFVLKRITIPVIEGLEIFFLLSDKKSLSSFKNFYVAVYGDTKILKLEYNPNSYVLVYISQNSILRVDYWIREGNENVMIWSYLTAFSEKKVNDKVYLSGILFNIQAKEFYKFDFKPF